MNINPLISTGLTYITPDFVYNNNYRPDQVASYCFNACSQYFIETYGVSYSYIKKNQIRVFNIDENYNYVQFYAYNYIPYISIIIDKVSENFIDSLLWQEGNFAEHKYNAILFKCIQLENKTIFIFSLKNMPINRYVKICLLKIHKKYIGNISIAIADIISYKFINKYDKYISTISQSVILPLIDKKIIKKSHFENNNDHDSNYLSNITGYKSEFIIDTFNINDIKYLKTIYLSRKPNLMIISINGNYMYFDEYILEIIKNIHNSDKYLFTSTLLLGNNSLNIQRIDSFIIYIYDNDSIQFILDFETYDNYVYDNIADDNYREYYNTKIICDNIDDDNIVTI
jgi:hypothetical protein